MNLHISPASLERTTPLTSGVSTQTSATARTAAALLPDAPGVSPARPAERYRGAGLNARIAFVVQQADFNQRVTGAQRTRVFLEQATTQLHTLKNALGASLAGAPEGEAAASRLAAFTAHWETRASATAGVLDADLRYHDDHGARQPFKVRALDWPAVNQAGAETLTVYPGGLGKTPVALSFAAQPEADEALARRIDRALAPAGIRAELKQPGNVPGAHGLNASGASSEASQQPSLVLSTPEAGWPEVRDQLMIQGSGKRFPGGRPSRAAAAPLPAAIEPQKWRIDERQALRDTLRQVVQAQALVGGALSHTETLLHEASTQIQAGLHAGVAGRQGAQTFAQMLEPPLGYQTFAAIGSSLKGMSRARVNALLKPR
ncbi:hypothetical protein QS306_03800 [Paraburkholderia bonniea]|uniref:hypothetical protein n=1 Tax=Paraburkholderia bonniea TaxID=2152891 RepID=UPI00257400D7|nr:hypothetical protein [Paraburkholderia bonniea]WJF90799.1 hypothetical protein QS306_03800 [Paraburkholderia bonniea]WJF94113.1 hypothetical protein QS308_03800 [Paraburkholderia bonniea]